MAMEGCRHPITEAGLGFLVNQIRTRWAVELKPGDARVTVSRDARVGTRDCLMIEAAHPRRVEGYLFQRVRVYVDRELMLPIRFEAYDWPEAGSGESKLVEEYTYTDLRLNPGLKDSDFDPANEQYSFGRF
jgi:hypothetical protein